MSEKYTSDCGALGVFVEITFQDEGFFVHFTTYCQNRNSLFRLTNKQIVRLVFGILFRLIYCFRFSRALGEISCLSYGYNVT